MIRWLGWIAAGLVLGGIVHLSTVLLMPRVATQDAYSRLAAVTESNSMSLMAQPSPDRALLPFMDPAFAMAVCRYDLAAAPLKVQLAVTQTYTAIAFYTRNGAAYYAINDRAAGRRLLELDLMTAEQRAGIQEDEDVTAADRLIVESPTETGLIVVRGLAPEPSLMPLVRGILSTAQCRPQVPPQP